MADLSRRGRALLEEPPRSNYSQAHLDRRVDEYHPESNPDGYIGLCIAENKLVWPLIESRISDLRTPLAHSSICYDDMVGCPDFRSKLADFMTEHVHGRRFDIDQIAALAGTGAVLELLFYVIADAGDAVLIPTPSYAGFWMDLETRDELEIVPVHTSADDDFTLTEELLDAAWDATERPITAFVYTNPDNPRGTVADREQIEMVAAWCDRRDIHLVVDELYALSIHGDAEFVSAAQVRPTLSDNIHLVWAFSKDFGMSGLRCGVLVTENDAVMNGVTALSYWAAVSGETQHTLGDLISDREWVERYVAGMQTALRTAYGSITDALDRHGIRYLPADGGFFFLLDLREHLAEPTWEAEDALWQRILDEANVNLTPGSACRNPEPGFLRICFATAPTETVLVGIERLARVLG
jgi:aspartate/methionine/tyrosine aminotransferase